MAMKALACLTMLFAVACTTSVSGGGGTAGAGASGQGGSPSTSSGPNPPSALKPNPNNPVGCPPALPTLGAPCPDDGSWLTCSYVGETCMEWVTCAGGCYGGTTVATVGVGVGGGDTTGGGYGGYPECE